MHISREVPVNGVCDAAKADGFLRAVVAFHDVRVVEGDDGVALWRS